MKALIMSAGVGNRLEPLTLAVPKPLVPLCNVPIMQRNIELLRKSGFKHITANLHYFPEQIQNYFRHGHAFGVKLGYSYEKTLLGTAGGVQKMSAKADIYDEDFLVMSSDVATDIDLKKLVAFHKKKKALATIALVEVEDPSEYGVVILDKDKKITAFQEKPKKGEELGNLINTGVYVFSSKILPVIRKNRFRDFGKEVFPHLVAEGLPFYGMTEKGYWRDIGNVRNYMAANFDCIGSNKKLIGKNTTIAKSAKLLGKVLIGDNCNIREGAVIKDSIIWSDTVVGADTAIENSIIGSWCYIEENTKIGSNSIIANRCRIRSGAHVPPDTSMAPDQVI